MAAEIKLLVVPSFVIPKLINYTIISQKSEYNTQYIEILTSYPDSTSKMGPGNVPYVICRCCLISSGFGKFTKLAVTKVPSKI